ncbi:hypothetical protein NKH36_18940 [Mesorhizobium sp. M1312]|uniref:DUF6894 family protein n=1 Tax=unclassified Mesorhizobium TaxID=325217 RepID=UPI003335EF49
MARFYFDLNDNGVLYPDDEGTELESLGALESEAVTALLEIARDRMPDGTYREVAFHVRDGASTPLFVVKVTFELLRNERSTDDQVGA